MLDADFTLADSATLAHHVILGQARPLSRALFRAWSTPACYDEVMLLVADLLDAHADTGIEMQTWPRALDVVTSHLTQDVEGAALLRSLEVRPWFTVVGTWHGTIREPVVVVPGRRHLDLAIGAWQEHIQAATSADAARLTRG